MENKPLKQPTTKRGQTSQLALVPTAGQSHIPAPTDPIMNELDLQPIDAHQGGSKSRLLQMALHEDDGAKWGVSDGIHRLGRDSLAPVCGR